VKLKSYSRENLAGNKLRVKGRWQNRMRQDASVSIERDVLPQGSDVTSVLLEGDSAEVFDTLAGIAMVAWNLGWRPPGLLGKVAQTVQDYRVEGDG
jgi:hypothetical protein